MAAWNISGQMRAHAEKIFRSALEAVDPGVCIHRICRRTNNILKIENRSYNLNSFKKIIVLGAGKACAPMAQAMEKILGPWLSEGIVIVKYGHESKTERIKIIQAGHPVPDENSKKAARALTEMADSADSTTLVIVLISGGASALAALPVHGITLEDKQKTTQILLECGADIHEINTIRKHVSQIKGGLLAKKIYPGAVICLAMSDVTGDDPGIIGSGPCTPDQGTFAQCLEIIKKYKITSLIPPGIHEHLKLGAGGFVAETPKPGNPVFTGTAYFITCKNINALEAARSEAVRNGYNTLILSSMIKGQTAQAAGFHMDIAKEILATGNPVALPACILSGGETTVRVRGKGKGGRNQEFALACVRHLNSPGHILVLAAGTDGTDGPTDAAGAIAYTDTPAKAKALGLDPEKFLNDNDSYHFFNLLSDLVITGPTRTNVMDIRIILVN